VVTWLTGDFATILGFGLNQWLEVIEDQGRTAALSPPEKQELTQVVAWDPIQQERGPSVHNLNGSVDTPVRQPLSRGHFLARLREQGPFAAHPLLHSLLDSQGQYGAASCCEVVFRVIGIFGGSTPGRHGSSAVVILLAAAIRIAALHQIVCALVVAHPV